MAKARKKRGHISDRLRFEVFKRDKFTCQYCGKSAPEVVLNCDHVQPVALDGTSDILNLITSCKPCNGGKGAIPLSDRSAIARQREMLDDLEERRQQLEMMVQWRSELSSLTDDTVTIIAKAASRGGYTPSDGGRSTIRKWLKRYSCQEILDAIDESFDTYLREDDAESWSKAFSKVPTFANMAKQDAAKPYLRRLLYIQAILRNRTGHGRTLEYLEHLYLSGASIDGMERDAKNTDYITHFTKPYDRWLASIGKPTNIRVFG